MPPPIPRLFLVFGKLEDGPLGAPCGSPMFPLRITQLGLFSPLSKSLDSTLKPNAIIHNDLEWVYFGAQAQIRGQDPKCGSKFGQGPKYGSRFGLGASMDPFPLGIQGPGPSWQVCIAPWWVPVAVHPPLTEVSSSL